MAATTFNIKSYVRNATRSISYVAVETVKNVNPTITEFAETNNEFIKEMYSSVRDYKKTMRLGKEAMANSEYIKIARETVDNFLDDLKSGNFYNKEREGKYSGAQALGIDTGDDWDMDLGSIDIDYGDGDDDSLTLSGMDDIGEKIVKGTGKSSMISADYIVKAGRANTKGILAQNEVLFGKINNSLFGINSTIASLGKGLIEPLSTHVNNSTKFYENTTDQLTKQTGYLEQIYNMLNNRFNPPKTETQRIKNRYGSVAGYDGIPDLRAYADIVKENFKDMTSLFTSVLGMMNMDGNGMMLRNMLSSPISSLMKGGSTALANKVLGKDFAKFNKSLTGLFGSTMLKINRSAAKDDGIKGFLASLLGIKPSGKKTIDTGKYEKGRVDWNGKDEKALREVIPIQLAQIISALTGNEPKVFNYETGKWVTYTGLQKDLTKTVKNISRRNTRDIQDQFETYFLSDNKNKNIDRDSKAFHTFKEDMQNLYHYLTMHNDKIPLSDVEWANLEQRMIKTGMFADSTGKGLMLQTNFKRIRSYYQRNYRNGKGHLNTIANGNMINGRNDIGEFYTNQENDPSSMYSMLFANTGMGKNGKASSFDNNFITSATDNKGNNLFFYLQNFYSKLERIADNTEYGRGGRRSRTAKGTGSKEYSVPNNTRVNINPSSNRFVDVDHSNATDGINIKESKNKEKSEEIKDKMEEFVKNNKTLKKMGKAGDFLAGLLDIPARSVRNVLDSADNMMYSMIYGKQDTGNDGILAKIMEGFDQTFASIKKSAKDLFRDHISPLISALGDKFSQMFGFKTFKDMKDKTLNGIKNSSFIKGTGEKLKSAGKWVKGAVSSTVSDVGDYFSNGKFSSGMKNLMGKVKSIKGKSGSNAANGGLVTKSGMISVSEGEMVIPSENNPYYIGKTNKASQLSKEKSVGGRWKALSNEVNKYWGEYAKGGKVKDNTKKRRNRSIIRATDRATRKAKQKTKKVAEDASEAASQIYEDTMDDVRETKAYAKFMNAFNFATDTIKDGASSFVARLFGKTTDKDGNPISDNESKKNIQKLMSNVWGELKKHAPGVAAGGVIGGATALLTGMVGGPLVGVLAGSAVGLGIKSEKFQETLFGKTDKKGNYKGGIFGPKLSNFIKDHGKKLAKFGITGGLGGALGLIPGGPIAGIIAGSALSFATESDDLRNYLFGEEGLLGKDADKKIKKALPKALVGAGALAITGPFGIMGNALLGSGLGFISESDKFKEAIFGVEDSLGQRQGGLLGIIRNDVIDPMKNYFKGGAKKFEDYMIEWIFKPMGNLFRPLGDKVGHMFNSIGDFLKGKIKDKVFEPFMKRFHNLLKGPLGLLGKVGKAGIGAVAGAGKAFGRTANRIGLEMDRTDIKKGYSSLSAEDRATMGASDIYLKNKNYRTKEYDKRAATMSSDELQESYDALRLYRSSANGKRTDKREIRQNAMNRILADSEYGTLLKEDKQLRKAFDSGSMDNVNEVVRQLTEKGKIGSGKSEKLLDYLGKQQKKIKSIDDTDLTEQEKSAKDAAARLGISVEGFMKDPTLSRLFNNDIRHKKKNNDEKGKSNIPDTAGDKIHPLDAVIHPIVTVKEALDLNNVKLHNIFEAICGIAKITPPTTSSDSAPGATKTKGPKLSNDVSKKLQKQFKDKAKQESAATKENKEDTEFHVTPNGGFIKTIKSSNGDITPDLRDSGTKEELDKQKNEEKNKNKFYSTFSSLGGVLGGLRDKLFGKKEEKQESALTKFVNGIGSKIGGLFGAGGTGGIVSSILGGLTKSLPAILVTALGAFGLNNLIKMVPDQYKTLDAEGNPVGDDKGFFANAKNGIDGIENMITNHTPGTYGEGEYERANMTDRVNTQMIGKNFLLKGQSKAVGNIVRRVPVVGKIGQKVVNGLGGVRDKVLNKGADLVKKGVNSKTGQAIIKQTKSFAGKATKTVTNQAKSLASKAGKAISDTKVGSKIAEIIPKITKLASSAIEKALSLLGVSGGEKIAKEAAEELTEAAVKAGSDKVAKSFAKSLNVVAQVAFVTAAVQNGWEDAKAILGILEEPTTKEKMMAAAINGINEAIPGIGGVIPTETIFNILFKIFGSWGVIDSSELTRKRAEAKATVNAYNSENGESYNIREYIKNVQGDYTTQEKIVKGAKSVGKGIVSGTKKLFGMEKKEEINRYGEPLKYNPNAKPIVKDTFNNIKSGISSKVSGLKEKGSAIKNGIKSFSGMREEIINSDNPEEAIKNKFSNTFSNISTNLSKAFGGQDNSKEETNSFKKLLGYADASKHPTMSGFDGLMKPKKTGNAAADQVNEITSSLTGQIAKMTVNMLRPFSMANTEISSVFGLGKNGEQDQTIQKKKSGGILSGLLGIGKKVVNSVTNQVEQPTGMGSGIHVSQKDPRYSGNKFGAHTIGETGCGPAVAATVLNRFGKDSSLNSTADYAKLKGYVAGSSGIGTKAGYFGDILGSNGIDSSYTNSQKAIRSAIGSGNPTILLGQDHSNFSKSNSPFGPNPHYVVAQGMDRKGNVIVDDPELGGTALYKNSILKNTKLGVVTGGSSKLPDLTGYGQLMSNTNKPKSSSALSAVNSALNVSGNLDIPAAGKTVNGNTNEAKVFQFYTQNGFTPAAAAGIMGNMEQESKFDPTIIQGGGKGPAAGIFQWENYNSKSKRWGELNKFAQSKGKPWTDLQTQLEFSMREMSETEKWMWTNPKTKSMFTVSGLEEYKKLTDPQQAAVAFENHFEQAGKPMMDVRKNAANKYYAQFTGAQFTNPVNFASSDFTSGTSTTSSGSSMDIGSIIDNAISSAFGNSLNAMGEKGKALSSLLGFTNTDNTEATNTLGSTSTTASTGSSGTSIAGDMANNFPYYNQADPRWGSKPYGKNTIKGAGCGPTSMAMVLKSYGKNVTPEDTINYSMKNGFRVEGVGTSWDFFKNIGNANGLSVDQFNDANKAKQYLQSGVPVIGSMRPGDFTKSGHFIVFSGLDGTNVKVNDPGSNDRTKKTWDADKSFSQAKSFWSISKDGTGSIKNSTGAGSGLILHDFTKMNQNPSTHISNDITRASTKQVIRKLDSNMKKYGGNSGVMNTDILSSIQIAVEYMKTIAQNTSHNVNIKAIVEILTSMMQLLGAKKVSAPNQIKAEQAVSDDRLNSMEKETQSIMQKLKALAEAV